MITLLTSHVSPGGVQSVAIKSQSVPLVAVDGNHYKGLERQEVAIAIVLASSRSVELVVARPLLNRWYEL